MFEIEEEVVKNYFGLIEKKYKDNPYHNKCHAADVAHAAFYFIMNSGLKNAYDDQENFAVLIACFGHDVGHPGLNNRFLVNNSEDLAIAYNDISVLENMHASITFSTMKTKASNCNILSKFSADNMCYIRKVVIEMILETDMSKHFESLGKFRSKALSI